MTTQASAISANKLIMDFFGRKDGQSPGEFLQEIKAVPEAGRIQLASAIAAQRGIDPSVLAFTPVSY